MSKEIEVQYTTSAISEGGRNGKVRTTDETLNFGTTEPKEVGGAGEAGKTNPEQLFAAGYAACFSSSAILAAETMGFNIQPDALKVTSHVSLGKDTQDNGMGLKVKIELEAEGLEDEQKQRLIQRANEICPYSKAVKGNIDVELITK